MNGANRLPLHSGRAGFLGFLLVFAGCVSYSTPADFDKALRRAQSGEATKVIAEIRERFGGMSETERQQAVRVLGEIRHPDASAYLKEIARNGQYQPVVRRDALGSLAKRNESGTPAFAAEVLASNKGLYSEPLADYLIEQNPEQAAAALHASVSGQVKDMSVKLMRFFGAKSYAPAIPDLKQAAESGHHPEQALESLAEMKQPEADNFLFATAGNAEHPQRAKALRLVLANRHASHPKETAVLVRAVLQRADDEPEDVANRAIELAPSVTATEEARESLQKIYRESKKEDLRTNALAALAKLEKTSPYIMAREMQVSLISLQMGLARWAPDAPPAAKTDRALPRRSEAKTSPRVARRDPIEEPKSSEARDPVRRSMEPKREARTTRRTVPRERSRTAPQRSARIPRMGSYPRNAAAYRNSFFAYLKTALPEEDARSLYGKVSNALRVYADSKSPSANLVRRAYTREYGTGQEEELRGLLAKGISQPGCVHAVISGIYREYPSDEMRIYATSQLFGIPRWQAATLIDYVRR